MEYPASDSYYWEAVEQLRWLFAEAYRRDLDAPNIASLATSDLRARPTVRSVTIAEIGDLGPAFFVLEASGKGQQLHSNPQGALCFHWPQFHHQVVVEGHAAFIDDATADQVWGRFSRDGQLAAWAAVMDDSRRDTATASPFAAAQDHFEGKTVPRAPGWEGVRLNPDMLQFWKIGWRKPHPRKRYTNKDNGGWTLQLTEPL
ncbi:MAG: pyridoxamine 5'-phosphate oxidase family protein [Halofilum sp. (in: g-proteobacteria)]|nr:pyridoxamine 5'-phosphate oxidase family protein [Halofilum sp. (in: g-proteobacteria)]